MLWIVQQWESAKHQRPSIRRPWLQTARRWIGTLWGAVGFEFLCFRTHPPLSHFTPYFHWDLYPCTVLCSSFFFHSNVLHIYGWYHGTNAGCRIKATNTLLFSSKYLQEFMSSSSSRQWNPHSHPPKSTVYSSYQPTIKALSLPEAFSCHKDNENRWSLFVFTQYKHFVPLLHKLLASIKHKLNTWRVDQVFNERRYILSGN